MKKRKVLHLIDSSGLYGAERMILTLLEELNNSQFPGILGCIQERITDSPLIEQEAQKIGIPVVKFIMRRRFSVIWNHRIHKYINENRIQIVHSHGYKPTIMLALMFRKRFKTVVTIHGWAKNANTIRGKIYEILDSIAIRKIDSVIAVSKAVITDLKKRKINMNKIKLIYNANKIKCEEVKFDVLTLRKKYGMMDNAYILGAVGRLATVKGHYYLIEAMDNVIKEIKNCILVIAGEGPLRCKLESLIEKKKLKERVKLIGYINNIDEFLFMIDLFILPSLSEGLPIALLEAIAAGKQIVASSVGGITEIICNIEDGILVPACDSQSLSEAIIKSYYSRNMMLEIHEKRKKIVEEKFSPKKMAKEYLTAYSDIIA